jgi:hypothetical protein
VQRYVLLSLQIFQVAILLLHGWIPLPPLKDLEPKRAASYQVMFGNRSARMPVRNGIRINTLHFVLHVATLAMALILASRFV